MRASPPIAASLLVSACLFSSSALAALIFPTQEQSAFSAGASVSPAHLVYNAASETLVSIGHADRLMYLSSPSAADGFLANDLVGAMTLVANIDHNGDVFGGSFVWFAASDQLGIGPSRSLLSATITGGEFEKYVSFPEGGNAIHFLQAQGTVTYVDPLIKSLVPDFDSILLNFYGCTCGGEWLFQRDFTATTGTSSPFLYGYRAQIAEPGTLALLLFATLAVASRSVTRRDR